MFAYVLCKSGLISVIVIMWMWIFQENQNFEIKNPKVQCRFDLVYLVLKPWLSIDAIAMHVCYVLNKSQLCMGLVKFAVMSRFWKEKFFRKFNAWNPKVRIWSSKFGFETLSLLWRNCYACLLMFCANLSFVQNSESFYNCDHARFWKIVIKY